MQQPKSRRGDFCCLWSKGVLFSLSFAFCTACRVTSVCDHKASTGMGKVKPKSRGPKKSCCNNILQELKECSELELDNKLCFFQTSNGAVNDFGQLVHNRPCMVLYPRSPQDIATTIKAANTTCKLTVAARGNGHSIHGQAQARNGIVIEMSKMPNEGIHVVLGQKPYVEASAGDLWIDVLKESLRLGLAPKSWTDYLDLTVGGTLSNAGVSGQAFRHGPQISNVLQLEVVTGKGEILTCSPKENSDLFFAVLGGLGQFGIITRAHIELEEAPERVRYMRLLYADFESFRKDIEYLISQPDKDLVNYVEGNVVTNTDDGWRSVPFPGQTLAPNLIPESSGPVLYCIEIAKYYNQRDAVLVDQHLASLLSSLSNLPSLVFTLDFTYFEFLYRVREVEEGLRRIQQWDVPHPWLTMFVPRSKIAKFNELIFKDIVCKGVNGPILVYPMNRSKWETRSSVVLPDENVFYMVSLLRSVVASGPGLESHCEQNAEILRVCETAGLGIKQYFPHYLNETDWKKHFGDAWGKFLSNKLKFDPNAVLAPGQRIFSRNKVNKCLTMA